jgi:hypothetical protein
VRVVGRDRLRLVVEPKATAPNHPRRVRPPRT